MCCSSSLSRTRDGLRHCPTHRHSRCPIATSYLKPRHLHQSNRLRPHRNALKSKAVNHRRFARFGDLNLASPPRDLFDSATAGEPCHRRLHHQNHCAIFYPMLALSSPDEAHSAVKPTPLHCLAVVTMFPSPSVTIVSCELPVSIASSSES